MTEDFEVYSEEIGLETAYYAACQCGGSGCSGSGSGDCQCGGTGCGGGGT